MAQFNNRQQGRREFVVRYDSQNPTFGKIAGLGFVQIVGEKTNEGLWPAKVLDGHYKGQTQDIAEKDLGRLDSKAGELNKCREMAGLRTEERRPYQGNQGDRPRKPMLFVRNAPFGIKARFVLDGNRVEFQTSHDDSNVLGDATPVLQYNGNSGNRTKRDSVTNRVIGQWSFVNYDLTWLDREGKEIKVGPMELSEQDDDAE